MDEKKANNNWKITGAKIFGVYSLYFLLQFPQVYFYNVSASQPLAWWFVMARLAAGIYLWALLCPLVFHFGRKFPVESRNFWHNFSIHLGLSFIFATTQTIIYHIIITLIRGISVSEPISFILSNPGHFLNFVTGGIAHYAILLAIHQAYMHFLEARSREFRLKEAELQSLKMQLQPHFLFNTLNAISALIYREPKIAERTIAQLSDLLRIAIKSVKTQEILLKDELDFLGKYIQVQQTLLQERLRVEWDIDASVLDALVPNMILQPLVENSILHGIAQLENGGQIHIAARRENGKLFLSVQDDGAGFADKVASKGIGLANTKARLRHLYGDSQTLTLNETPPSGVRVDIAMPFHRK